MTHDDRALLMAAMQDVTPLKPTTRIPHARATLHLPKRKPTKPARRTRLDTYPSAFWAYKV
jgi:DNA-nicking Smr family endonuclease